MIALSIARAAGSNFTGIKYDLWQLYWLTMSANFGLILASGAAFRAFYINHRNSKHSSHSWEGNIKEWPSSQANPSNRSLHGAQHKGQTFFCDSESETTSGSSSKPFARDGSGHVYREKGSEWNNRLDSKHSFSSRDTRDTEDSDVDFGTAQGFFHIQQPRRVIIAPRMPRLG
ncbi:hypothetical protein N7456_011687 [Penicillium angulare]|uniref:Uncharacterized protein n=1 Tax=Penicillium angulare TaxID=116970 RepID=A0A9W9EUB6_9EURO|nr:hypothetical protein N7456_011687 [Penicillium angulare]